MELRFLGYETAILHSPLPQDECLRRLREAIEADGPAKARVIGRVGTTSLRLRKRLAPTMHNSFQIFLTARITSESGSTRLTCHFGPDRLVVGFTAVWFLAVIGFGAAMLTLATKGAIHFGTNDPGPFVPLIMIAGGIGVVGFGRYLARGDRRFLVDFLKSTIQARELAERPTAAVARRS